MKLKIYIASLVFIILLFLISINWIVLPVFILFMFAGIPLLTFFNYERFGFIERIIISFLLADLWFFVFHLFVILQIEVLKYFILLFLSGSTILSYVRRKTILKALRFERIKFSEKNTLLLLLLISILVVSPAFSIRTILDTDYIPEAWQGLNIRDQIRNSGKVALWTSELLVGYPRFVYDGFISYEKLSLMGFIFENNYFGSINALLFILFIFILLGVYSYCLRLGMNEYWSLIPPGFILGSYLFIQLLGLGYIRALMSIALYPVILIISKDFAQNWKLFAIFSAISFFHHPMYGSIVLIFCFLSIILRFNLNVPVNALIKSSICLLVITSFWLIPAITTKEYSLTTTTDIQSIGELSVNYIKFLFGLIIKEDDYFWLFFMIGLITTILYNPVQAYNLAASTIFSAVYFIPTFQSVEFQRLRWLFFILFSISIGTMGFLKNKKIKVILFAIIILFLLVKFLTPYQQLKKFHVDKDELEKKYRFDILSKLKELPRGRIVTYGEYAAVFDNFLQLISKKDIIHYGMYHGQHMQLFEKVRSSDGKYGFPTDAIKTLNYLKATFTPFILSSECNDKINGAKTTIKISKEAKSDVKLVFAEDCIRVFEINNVSFAEQTTLVNTPENESLYMSWNNSWKAHGIKGIRADLTINKEQDLSEIHYPEPLNYSRDDNEHIKIKNPSENRWIVIKEQYHPYWNAYQSEKELSVYKSNVGTMLLKSETDKDIELEFKTPLFVQGLALVSLICILWLLISIKRFSIK